VKVITEDKKRELVRKTVNSLNESIYAFNRFILERPSHPEDIEDSSTVALINLSKEIQKKAEKHLKAIRTPSKMDGRLACVKRPWFSRKELEIICDVLGLVGVNKSWVELSKYSYKQIKQAENWAAKSYLQASDNNVRVPKRPRFL